jgi:sulfotransferase family protein
MNAKGNDRPIVIVACPRSGTTLLQLMLHGHSRIAIPPSTLFLLPTYFRRLQFGDLELRENRRRLSRFVVRRRYKIDDLGLDARWLRRQIVEAPPTVGSAIGTVYRAYADRLQKPRWGDKRPAYERYLEIVMRLFPDAQLIHLVRDPRDCVASLKGMRWWKRGIYHSISAWAQSVDHTDEALRRWPGSLTRVSYERLVADPEPELRALTEALGEAYDPQMAEPELIAASVVPDERHWHANTRGAPTSRAVGRWRSELEPWEVALCDHVLAGRMARLGYEPSGAPYPGAVHVARFSYVHRTRTAHRAWRLAKDRWNRRNEPNPVAARLTSAQRATAFS